MAFLPDPRDQARDGVIYLVHLDQPFHHAKHYLGFVESDLGERLDERMERHRRGTGSKLLRAVAKAGIGWRVVRTWRGTRADERRMKNAKMTPRYCPICSASPTKIAYLEPGPPGLQH